MDVLVTLSIIGFFGLILTFALKRSTSKEHQRRCPNCGEPLPVVRRPTNTRQMMWGGWTCTRCDAELDRSAKVIREGRPESAILSGGLDQVEHTGGEGGLTESVAGGSLGLHEVATDVTLDFDEEHARQEVPSEVEQS